MGWIVLLCFSGYVFLFSSFTVAKASAREADITGEIEAHNKWDSELEDKLIGYMFKIIAKAFVAGSDTDKFSRENIERLNKMSEEKFQKQYAKVYEAVKECAILAERYNITENMPKEAAIHKIQQLDKKEIYAAIDAIPDKVIAGQFRRYLEEKKQEIVKSNIAGQINQVWNKVIEKAK